MGVNQLHFFFGSPLTLLLRACTCMALQLPMTDSTYTVRACMALQLPMTDSTYTVRACMALQLPMTDSTSVRAVKTDERLTKIRNSRSNAKCIDFYFPSVF